MAKSLSKGASQTRRETDASSGKQALPLQHIAIIMDGNRRWASNRGLPQFLGHKEGVKTLKNIVRHAGQLGLKYLTVYAFSSENWQRSKEEVQYLFELFSIVLRDELGELHENKVKLSFLGDLSAVPPRLKKNMQKAMDFTQANTGLALQVAINYGARMEITTAVREIAQQVALGKLSLGEITEDTISAHLYTRQMPDPELLIRTGGEMRLSNYLLWQCAYAELYVTPVNWPDFSSTDLDRAIQEFGNRERRYGS